MQNNTNWTPSPEDNKLNISDKNLINEIEAKGIIASELFIFDLDNNEEITAQLILKIHHIAFSELYDWAGKWRNTSVIVGDLHPPEPNKVLQLMYQFLNNLNFKIDTVNNLDDYINCLSYAHYEFVKIHPFNNGNGRTGRLLMNLVALKFGYKPLELYHRTGDSRTIYINAMKAADKGDFSQLDNLVRKELITF